MISTELVVLIVFAILAAGLLLGRDKPRSVRPPLGTSDIVLLCMALFLLAFILTMIVTFWVKGAVPDTLIQYTMGAGGVEAVMLAAIKISKVIAGNKPGESEESNE